jgi:glycosyltransferase 2 family protein
VHSSCRRTSTAAGNGRHQSARLPGVVALGILAVLVWRLGTGPFTAGLARVDAGSLAAASGVAVVTTLSCAWRWTLVARGLGVALPLPTAVAAYYRSQFLNVATPGGVLGDVERALRHGRDVGDTSRGVRSVVWERFAGQVVLVVVAGSALVLLPSPVRQAARGAGLVAAAATLALGLLVAVHRWGPLSAHGPGRAPAWVRAAGRARADLRAVALPRRTRSRILLASVVAMAGHVLTFLVATRTAGSGAAPLQVLPLALVVLLAMGLPNIAGWGPREGVAAWAFSAGGLGAQQGVATAVVYGVMVFVGALPGGLLILVAGVRHTWSVGRG